MGKKNKKNKKNTTFTSENRLGSVGYGLKVASVLKSRKASTELNMVAEKVGDCSSSGEENSNDSNDSSNDSSNEDDDNFDSFNISTDSHQHTTTTLRTSTELSYKESRLSHRVAKLQTTAKLMLRMRLSLLSTPIDWNKMRKAIEEIEALGKPLEKYVAGVALEELQLMTEVLNDHDIVQQLREALDNSSTMTATEQTDLLKKTLAKGKKVRRQSVSM